MSATDLACVGTERRGRVRQLGLNGIDYVEVSDDQLTITVTFLQKAPEKIGVGNVRIDGGERVTGIEVVGVTLCREEDPDLDDCMKVRVDRFGDFSTYTLCVVERRPDGRPGREPLEGFDPRYSCVELSFKAGCPSPLDCEPADDCPPPERDEPEISYLAKDYETFRRLILDRLALVMPDWRERHAPDVQMALVEVLAYAGDQLSYLQDAVGTEAYLETARLRRSVRRHARLVDYAMHDGANARAWVCVEVDAPLTLAPDDLVFLTGTADPPSVAFDELKPRELDAAQAFHPMGPREVSLSPAHNRIELWTWGDSECCLPVGATRATLKDGQPAKDRDRPLALAPGDVLILEEVVGPATGNPADADPAHRQAVRLTEVVRGRDAAYDQPVVEVAWAAEDALRFPLCLSSLAGEDCEPVEPVSVARGNVVLADHGRWIDFCGGDRERLDVPPAETPLPGCEGICAPSDPEPEPVRFEPVLAGLPVTQAAPLPSPARIAALQAAIAARIAEAVEADLRALLADLREGAELTEEQRDWLVTVFGGRAVVEAGIDSAPADAAESLETLLGLEHELLQRKLERTDWLARRAGAGYVLDAGEVAELGGLWGERYAAPLDPGSPALWGPASGALASDPREALPAVSLDEFPDGPPEGPAAEAADVPWTPRRDLLDVHGRERHFVGEVDDDGRLHLRFGYAAGDVPVPVPGATLVARYRVGNGTAGNVAAEAIGRIALCTTRTSAIRRVRNPLAAEGGTDPEPEREVKLVAPHAFRRRLERAVTGGDYATLAGEQPGVQRAVARLRWTGSWYEARVGVDPLGTDRPPPELLRSIGDRLERYRRMGHDLSVRPAEYASLDLGLEVCVAPGYERGHVRVRIAELLGPRGMFAPDEQTFGEGVAASAIVAAVQAVPGVEWVEVRHLRRMFETDDSALATGVLRLGPLEVARLDGDPSFPERGRLELELRGGL
ncbi:MAG TPA: putative baseplate assembly protein [Thermoleophilaceae bacterium]|jgi:predicted phage baseplate assembly protein